MLIKASLEQHQLSLPAHLPLALGCPGAGSGGRGRCMCGEEGTTHCEATGWAWALLEEEEKGRRKEEVVSSAFQHPGEGARGLVRARGERQKEREATGTASPLPIRPQQSGGLWDRPAHSVPGRGWRVQFAPWGRNGPLWLAPSSSLSLSLSLFPRRRERKKKGPGGGGG